MEVSQDFRSECSGAMTQVEVLFATTQSAPDLAVDFLLTDTSDHQVIMQQRIKDIPGKDQVWLSFPFHPLVGTKDHLYRMTLTAPGSSQDNWLALWNTTTNIYRGGDAIVEGVPTNMDLIFRYTCRMPPLSDWLD
ncbi:MAG: hypothetical protein IH586_05175 [Anaerolineaceae bacterium]|nr:hypothetical protein [Anaerolineaceae bacterium]